MGRLHRRCSKSSGLVSLAMVALALATAGGCVSVLTTAAYLIKGTNTPAEYTGLKGKKVLVLVKPPVTMDYTNANVHNDLAGEIGFRLAQNVKKIKVIDNREVMKWTDENNWDDYVEVGKAMDAEMIVAIELEAFDTLLDQTLYQGRATAKVEVYDLTEGKDQVTFKKEFPRVLYPPNSAVPIGDKTPSEFRNDYISVLSDAIGRTFYPHDSYQNFAVDSTTLD